MATDLQPICSTTNKSKSTFIRLTDDEHSKLQEIKRITGLSFPQIFKRALFNIHIKQPLVSKEQAREIIKELNRIGINVNQIARKLNSGIFNGYLEEIRNMEHAITKMKQTISEFGKGKR